MQQVIKNNRDITNKKKYNVQRIPESLKNKKMIKIIKKHPKNGRG